VLARKKESVLSGLFPPRLPVNSATLRKLENRTPLYRKVSEAELHACRYAVEDSMHVVSQYHRAM
jgi:hypothetical protein